MTSGILEKSYWQETAPLDTLHSHEALPGQSDVVIIGGGITGLSTAYWLQRTGIRFVVLDKNIMGYGASSRNAGLLLAGTAEHFARLVAAVSLPEAKILWDFSIKNNTLLEDFIHTHKIDCDFRKEGSLAIASSEAEANEIRESVQLLQENGYGSEWLTQSDLRKLFKLPLPENFLGARFYKEDATFHPGRFLFGLGKQILQKNGKLYPRTEVISISETGDDVTIETSAGTLTCHMVVLATNGYASLVYPYFQKKIEPVRGQIIATAPTDRRLPPMAMLTNFGYEYWQQTPDGRLMLGGMRWSAEDADVGKLDETPDPNLRKNLENFMDSTFTGLGPLTVTHNWAGIMGFSIDGLPIIGKLPGRNTLLTAGGYTGHGMSFGFLSGKILADIIQTGKTGESIQLFSPGRFLI
ncbi:MAG: FAD-binding oxidoreductase [Calditrichaeota bacterium]|nr:FAD-binding oxidoreductase [Calditrichota bacterium]